MGRDSAAARPRAILFDWDGTLVESCHFILKAHNHVRQKYGLPPWRHEDIFGRSSQSARELYPRLYGDRHEEAMAALYAYVDAHHLDDLKPCAHAGELLRDLAQKDIPIGVVSNKRHAVLLREIDHQGWQDFFSVIIGAGEAARDKPSPEPLLLAFERLTLAHDATLEGLRPGECWYVGDSEIDLASAGAAGMVQAFLSGDVANESPRSEGPNSADRNDTGMTGHARELMKKYRPAIVLNSLHDLYIF